MRSTDSISELYNEQLQLEESIIPLRKEKSLVFSLCKRAIQAKILTLGGTKLRQIPLIKNDI